MALQHHAAAANPIKNITLQAQVKCPLTCFVSCRQLAAQQVLIQPAFHVHSAASSPTSKTMPDPLDAPTVEPLKLHNCHSMLPASYQHDISAHCLCYCCCRHGQFSIAAVVFQALPRASLVSFCICNLCWSGLSISMHFQHSLADYWSFAACPAHDQGSLSLTAAWPSCSAVQLMRSLPASSPAPLLPSPHPPSPPHTQGAPAKLC